MQTLSDFLSPLDPETSLKVREKLARDLLQTSELGFIENCLWIRTKKGEVQLLKLNPVQQKIYAVIEKLRKEKKPIRIIILKARRPGSSTLGSALLYVDTIKNEHARSMIIANELKPANEIFDMVKLYDEKLPFVMEKDRSNIREIAYTNKSRIVVETAEDVSTGRAGTYTNLLISEMAHFRDPKTLMGALRPTVPNEPNTMIIIESTPCGINYFYDMWQRAKRGDSEYEPIFVGWHEDPTNVKPIPPNFEMTEEEKKIAGEHLLTAEQIYWRRTTINDYFNGDTKLFAQEYPINDQECFLGSGRPVFNQEKLHGMLKRALKPRMVGKLVEESGKVSFQNDSNGCLRIWEESIPKTSYVIGVDTSEGLEDGDYSAAIVRDKRTWEQMAVLRGKFAPYILAQELRLLGKYYNMAIIAVENNNHGFAVNQELEENLRYPSLHKEKNFDNTERVDTRKFFSTNTKTKSMIINNLQRVIHDDSLIIRSKREIGELIVYAHLEGNKMGAPKGEYDDMVMAEAICAHLLLKNQKITERMEEYRREKEEHPRKYLPPLARPWIRHT